MSRLSTRAWIQRANDAIEYAEREGIETDVLRLVVEVAKTAQDLREEKSKMYTKAFNSNARRVANEKFGRAIRALIGETPSCD